MTDWKQWKSHSSLLMKIVSGCHVGPWRRPSLDTRSGLYGVSADGPLAHLHLLLPRLDGLLGGREGASFGTRQLLAQIQRLRFLILVKLAKFGLLFLMGDSEDARDGLADHANLGQLARCPSRDLSDSEGRQFLLQLIELFHQLFLLLAAQFVSLDFCHFS